MIIQRILQLLEEKNIKMVDLCRYLGINTSTMTNWKNRSTDPPAKYIFPICEFLHVSCEYILTGAEKKNAFSISAEDLEWLRLIHNLPYDAQLEFKGELRGYLKAVEKSDEKAEGLREAK